MIPFEDTDIVYLKGVGPSEEHSVVALGETCLEILISDCPGAVFCGQFELEASPARNSVRDGGVFFLCTSRKRKEEEQMIKYLFHQSIVKDIS